MRNLPWMQATQQAKRTLNFDLYHHSNDVWVHKDLQQGDIVRCDLPTYDPVERDYVVGPRNCLVTGIDIDRDTQEIIALRLVRFSYNILDHNAGHEPLYDPRASYLRGKLTGFRDQVLLRTGRVEAVQMESTYFGFYLDRIGRMDPALFPEVNRHMQTALRQRDHSQTGYSQTFRQHGEIDYSNSVMVPSLDPDACRAPGAFFMPVRAGQHLADMPEDARASFLDARERQRLAMDVERIIVLKRERELRRGVYDRKNAEQTQLRKLLGLLKSARKASLRAEDLETLIDSAAGILKTAEQENRADIAELNEDAIIRLRDIPDYRSLLRKHFGITETPAQLDEKLRERFRGATAAVHLNGSLKDLQNLGIGGLMREPAINLPEHLWQGRYLMLRIPDLHDPENMGDAFRPCAIWKAYARMGEDGMPVLAGFELHPCTREGAKDSMFRMKVRPLETTNPRPSFLLADMIVRAPLDSLYFQPDQREDFYFELLPSMVRELGVKRRLATEHPRGLRVFGLRDIPGGWQEIALPPAPDEKLRERLVHWRKARFTPTTAPDIRPMRGSANTARNFRFTRKGAAPA